MDKQTPSENSPSRPTQDYENIQLTEHTPLDYTSIPHGLCSDNLDSNSIKEKEEASQQSGETLRLASPNSLNTHVETQLQPGTYVVQSVKNQTVFKYDNTENAAQSDCVTIFSEVVEPLRNINDDLPNSMVTYYNVLPDVDETANALTYRDNSDFNQNDYVEEQTQSNLNLTLEEAQSTNEINRENSNNAVTVIENIRVETLAHGDTELNVQIAPNNANLNAILEQLEPVIQSILTQTCITIVPQMTDNKKDKQLPQLYLNVLEASRLPENNEGIPNEDKYSGYQSVSKDIIASQNVQISSDPTTCKDKVMQFDNSITSSQFEDSDVNIPKAIAESVLNNLFSTIVNKIKESSTKFNLTSDLNNKTDEETYFQTIQPRCQILKLNSTSTAEDIDPKMKSPILPNTSEYIEVLSTEHSDKPTNLFIPIDTMDIKLSTEELDKALFAKMSLHSASKNTDHNEINSEQQQKIMESPTPLELLSNCKNEDKLKVLTAHPSHIRNLEDFKVNEYSTELKFSSKSILEEVLEAKTPKNLKVYKKSTEQSSESLLMISRLSIQMQNRKLEDFDPQITENSLNALKDQRNDKVSAKESSNEVVLIKTVPTESNDKLQVAQSSHSPDDTEKISSQSDVAIAAQVINETNESNILKEHATQLIHHVGSNIITDTAYRELPNAYETCVLLTQRANVFQPTRKSPQNFDSMPEKQNEGSLITLDIINEESSQFGSNIMVPVKSDPIPKKPVDYDLYPRPAGTYPPPGAYPPQGYPPPGGYPPAGGYPGGYPPQNYPPFGPPQPGMYPQAGYPGYPQGYPPGQYGQGGSAVEGACCGACLGCLAMTLCSCCASSMMGGGDTYAAPVGGAPGVMPAPGVTSAPGVTPVPAGGYTPDPDPNAPLPHEDYNNEYHNNEYHHNEDHISTTEPDPDDD